MSIKIYNAYKIKELGLAESVEFTRDLREALSDYIYKEYFMRGLTYNINKMIQYNVWAKLKYADEAFEVNCIRFVSSATDKNSNLDESYNYLAEHSLLHSAMDVAMEFAEHNEICESMMIYPDNGSTKVQFFDDYICRFMNELTNGKIDDTKGLISKYNIEDYHYQDQSSKPDYVSDSQWKEREQYWKKLKEQHEYIPIHCGLSVFILNNDIFKSYIVNKVNGENNNFENELAFYMNKYITSEKNRRYFEELMLFWYFKVTINDYITKELITVDNQYTFDWIQSLKFIDEYHKHGINGKIDIDIKGQEEGILLKDLYNKMMIEVYNPVDEDSQFISDVYKEFDEATKEYVIDYSKETVQDIIHGRNGKSVMSLGQSKFDKEPDIRTLDIYKEVKGDN